MNVLLITEFFPATEHDPITGGVERRTVELLRRIAGQMEVTVLCSSQPGTARQSSVYGCRVIRCGIPYPYCNHGHILRRLSFACCAFVRGMGMDKPSVVEAACFLAYLPAALLAAWRNVPSLITYHEVWIGSWIRLKGYRTGLLGELWERLAVRLPWTRFVAVSDYTRRQLCKVGVPEPLITVIPNGVTALPGGSRRKDIVTQGKSVCCVARLIPSKRVDVLLEAVALAKEKGTAFTVNIIGQGPERASLQERAVRLKIADQVTFRGRIEKDDEVRAIVAGSHIFVLLSEVEGFGISLLEAMREGVPYVATDIAPFREITEQGRGGILVPPGNANAACEALLQLAAHSALYERKQQEAVELSRKYDWDSLSSQLQNLYVEAARHRDRTEEADEEESGTRGQTRPEDPGPLFHP
jgi:glycosyltransferase involved in cell wall biosynthesis